MTSDDIRKSIRKKFRDSRRYAVVDEVGVCTGFTETWDSPRRIDMMVLDCFRCNDFYIEGIEIKISKSDLKRELNEPEKHEVFFQSIDGYTIAAPTELLKEMKDLIPKEWGLLGINEATFEARYIRRPDNLTDWIDRKTVDRGFFASVVRSVVNQVGREIRNEQW